MLEQLAATPTLPASHPAFQHGRLYTTSPPAGPTVSWSSPWRPRTDESQDTSPPWLTATEYREEATVLEDKLARLASLLRLSTHTVIYSGAGLSTQTALRLWGERKRSQAI